MKEKDNKDLVKGCFVGCATVTGLTILILFFFFLWLYLPYDNYPLRAYFSKEHVLASEFQISLKDKSLQRICWSFIRMASRKRHENLPVNLCEAAVERDMRNIEQLKKVPLFSVHLLATANQQEEQWLFFAPVPAQGKICQLLFNFSSLFVPQKGKKHLNGAIVWTRDGERGFSLFKGHAMMGNLLPPMALAAKVIDKGPGKSPVDSFVSRHWPKGKRLLSFVVDNRLCTFDRLVKEETNFKGVAAIGDLLGLNEMGIVADFHLKSPMDKLAFELWLRKATDTLLPSPFSVDIKKIEQFKGYFRATLSVKGIAAAVDKLEESSKRVMATD